MPLAPALYVAPRRRPALRQAGLPLVRPAGRPAGPWAEAGGVALVALVVYALTRTDNLALSHDSLVYLRSIEAGGGPGFLHPHHLIYNPIAAAWLRAMEGLGLAGDVPRAVALMNGVFGALAVGAAYALLRVRAALPRGLALAGATAAGASFGLWYYSGCVEVYVLPLFLLLAALLVLLAPRLTPRAVVGVGLLHGAAMLAHQVHVLFGFVVLVALWRASGRTGGGRPFVAGAALYVGAGAAVVVAGYAAAVVGVLGLREPAAAWAWFTGYAQSGHFWYAPSPGTLAKAAVGFTRAVVGGHSAFALDGVQAAVVRAFPARSLADEAFLVRNVAPGVAGVLLAGAAAVGLGLVGAVVAGLRRRRQWPAGVRAVAVPLGVWLGVYAAFFVCWDPQNVEFWIPQATALWLLVALGLAPSAGERSATRRARTRALAALAALLFVVNLFGSMLPAMDRDNDVYHARFAPLASALSPGDVVVLGHAHLAHDYVRRLTPATPVALTDLLEGETIPPPEAISRALDGAIERARAGGHRVVFAPEAFRPLPSTVANYAGRADVAALAERLRARWGPYVRPFPADTTGAFLLLSPR